MHPLTFVSIALGVALLAKLFHVSWMCAAPPTQPPPIATPPVQAQQPAQAVPYSTFAGDANNPLTQPGLLRPQPPTSADAFIPLPPVKY